MKTPDTLTAGIGSTLEWVKQREKNGRLAVEQCENAIARLRNERDKNDPKHDGRAWETEMKALQSDLDWCEDAHRKLRQDFMKLEKEVVPAKREAGESISQGEGSRIIEMAVVHLRLGWEQVKLVASQSLPLCKTEIEALAVLAPVMDTCLVSAIENAVAEQSLPQWVAVSAKAGL